MVCGVVWWGEGAALHARRTCRACMLLFVLPWCYKMHRPCVRLLLAVPLPSAVPEPVPPTNWALGRPALMSSTLPQTTGITATYDASNSVSGDFAIPVAFGGCSVTQQQLRPWWAVDLGQPVTVARVSIYTQPPCLPSCDGGDQGRRCWWAEQGCVMSQCCAAPVVLCITLAVLRCLLW